MSNQVATYTAQTRELIGSTALDRGPRPEASETARAANGRQSPAIAAVAGSDASPDQAHADLVQAISQGDQQALETLYRETSPRVYGWALRITQRADLAEEVVSDVYVQAWRRAQTHDPARGTVLAWLLVACRSRALDALRRERNADTPQPEVSDQTETTAPAPDDLLASTEQSTAVHRALMSLTNSERQLLGLAFFRDYSHAELARITGLPLGTVKSRLRRSLQALQAHV